MAAAAGGADAGLRVVPGAPVIDARGVGVTIGGRAILEDVDLRLEAGEHLVVLGPNGGGKTTLLRVLATYRFPTRGRVELLGHRLGRVDVRALRPRIGLASIALDPLVDAVPALDLVAAAHRGAMAPARRGEVDPGERAAAERALERVGAGHLGARRVDTLSQGERQRVRIARALATTPDLLLLDEPFAGLDLGGREALLVDLDRLLVASDGPTVVLVTHHLEEVPVGSSRTLLLARGRVAAAGPTADVLTSSQVSAVFGVSVRVERDAAGRYRATGAAPPRST